jgi:hypothetical protein
MISLPMLGNEAPHHHHLWNWIKLKCFVTEPNHFIRLARLAPPIVQDSNNRTIAQGSEAAALLSRDLQVRNCRDLIRHSVEQATGVTATPEVPCTASFKTIRTSFYDRVQLTLRNERISTYVAGRCGIQLLNKVHPHTSKWERYGHQLHASALNPGE